MVESITSLLANAFGANKQKFHAALPNLYACNMPVKCSSKFTCQGITFPSSVAILLSSSF